MLSCRNGRDTQTFLFPKQVESQQIKDKITADKYITPSKLVFLVNKNPFFLKNKLVIESCLENVGEEFILIVNPYGDEFPFGGTNPFLISFSRSNEHIHYMGQLYPPAPPLPIEIIVPSKSKIIFVAEIPLDLYSWIGIPEVVLDWAFYYYNEPYPKGSINIKLPKN